MKITQRSFTAGEVSHEIGARADFEKYGDALETCRNFFIKTQGGAYNRPGFRFVGEVNDSTVTHRLIPFSFNTEQTYVLDFGHQTMRVIMDGGYVIDSGTGLPYEIVTPFAAADLFRLRYSQTADVMTLTCHGYDPQELSRLAHDNWTIAPIDFTSKVTAPTGLSVVTVGTGAGTYTKTYRYVVTAFDANGVESLASAEVAITANSLSTTAGVRVSWAVVTGADSYRIYKDPSNGSGVYGYIGETTATTFEDYNFAPDTSLTPPKDNLPFAGADDKPLAVGFYQQRRIFANTVNNPQRFFATQTGVLDSMRRSTPPRDTDAIEADVISRQVNEIRHIVDQDMLILLTAGSEMRVTEGVDYVLTPATFGVRVASRFGASDVTPVTAGDTVVFVQEQGSRLVGLTARGVDMSGEPTLLGNDLSILSRHLFDGYQIVDMAYEKEPYGIIWMVRDDGTLLGLTYQRLHKVWGLHRHDTQGKFKSVACITEGGRTATYALIERTIGGVPKLYVERLEPREEQVPEDCFYVDSGLSYNGAPTITIAGLDHLVGETVAVLADGNVVSDLVVDASGAITLPFDASKVHVGLPYICEITTLSIDDNARTMLGRKKSVSELAIRFYQSRGGHIGPKGKSLQELRPRDVTDGYGTIQLKTEERRVAMRRGWGDGGQVTIQQNDPLPMAILAVTPDVDID